MKVVVNISTFLLVLRLIECISMESVTNKNDTNDLRSLVASLKSTLDHLNIQVSTLWRIKGGAQFIRWGKSVCPDKDTELVYEGFAASGYLASYGGGVNYLCLPRDPEYGSNYTGRMNSAIYGAKYDSDADFFGTKNGDGLPCAVCRSSSDVTSVMIPARRTCYKSWRKQYNGYLATNRDGSYGSKDYICINEDPDSFATAEDHGLRAIFQSTVASCGSLACPPYINYRRLTCVVCTK